MISNEKRKRAVSLVEESSKAGARQSKACEILGITARTLQRWKKTDDKSIKKDQRQYRKSVPANKLSSEEKEEIMRICNSREYMNLPPSQIIPALADQGIFIGSESSFIEFCMKMGSSGIEEKAKLVKGTNQRDL